MTLSESNPSHQNHTSSHTISHTIRQAVPSDALAIATIHVRAWQQAYPNIIPQAHLDQLSIEARHRMWQDSLQKIHTQEIDDRWVWVAEQEDQEEPAHRLYGWAVLGPNRDIDLAHTQTNTQTEIQTNPTKQIAVHALELWAIYTLETAWGRGIAADLWDAVYTKAQQIKQDTQQANPQLAHMHQQHKPWVITLWVLADNERAQRFYRKQGFVVDTSEAGSKWVNIGGRELRELRYVRLIA